MGKVVRLKQRREAVMYRPVVSVSPLVRRSQRLEELSRRIAREVLDPAGADAASLVIWAQQLVLEGGEFLRDVVPIALSTLSCADVAE